jgi:predicted HTH transcriptional regulator
MANSAGGRIIYGVSADPINSWFPGELDPVERSSITTETLQQIISSRIQPRLRGVNIYAVPITEERALYVVDIPQSTTAHQASDQRYYKRVNNISQPMEDYEIRDVMNRKSAITLALRIIPDLTRDQVRTESTTS